MDLDDQCRQLEPNDIVPNRYNIDVTLSEILRKADENEGYVEYIERHRDTSSGREYLVKWIGFKARTWEQGEYVTEEVKKDYESSII